MKLFKLIYLFYLKNYKAFMHLAQLSICVFVFYISGHKEIIDFTGKGLWIQLFLITSSYFLVEFILKKLEFKKEVEKELERIKKESL